MNNVKESNSLPSIQLVENRGWKTVEVNGKKALIPDQWEAGPLSLIAQIIAGQSPSGSLVTSGKPTEQSYDFHQGNADFGVSHTLNSGKVIPKSLAPRFCKKGTLLMSVRAPVGAINFASNDLCFGRGLCAINVERGSKEYIYFQLNKNKEHLQSNAQGSTFEAVKISDVRELEILIAPHSEQTLIAQVLTAQESQVHDLRKLAQAERQRLAWLSEELLSGRLRVEEDPTAESVVVSRNEKGEPAEVLPGVRVVGNRGWKTVEVSGAEVSIPMDWDFQLVEHCARNISGATPPTGNPSYWGGELLWVTPGDMDDLDGAYIKDSNKKLTPAGYNLMGNRVVKPGSVVFSTRGSIGKVATNKEEIRISQSCEAFFFEDANPEFAVFYFRMIMDELKKKGAGTTFMSVTKKDIKELPFVRPSRNKQTLIAQVLTAQETQVLEIERLADLEQQRFEWLSDELLSGRIRVKTTKED